MYCRIVILLILYFLLLPTVVTGVVKVDIVVTGVEEKIKTNVLAGLKINLQKDNERLQHSAIRMLHKKADQDILAALAPFGFYNPVIKSHLTVSTDGWRAEYIIDKGPPVLVEDLVLEVTGAGSRDKKLLRILAQFPLQKGSVLDQDLYEQGKKKLINAAIQSGFLDGSYSVKELRINRKTNRGVIKLILDTGPQYLFGQTSSSREVIKNKLLQRYLPYKEGDPYTPAKLFELQSILYKTDYFSRVSAQGLQNEANGLKIPVQLELVPPEHKNKYSLGFGYATDTGVRGKIDWTNRFLNKSGHKMNALLQLSERENTVSLSLEAPVRNPRYNTIVHTLTYQNEEWEDTTTELFTVAVTRGFDGPQFKLSGGLELRDEIYDIGNTSGDGTFLIPSVNIGFTYADDILNTKNGLQASLGIRGGADLLLSDADFVQATLNGKAILTPLEQWRVIGRGSLGITAVDSIDSLPPSLRFYTGGDSTIRGYKYKSIGTEDDSGEVIGGRFLVVGSIELERSLTERWGLAGFWDGGTAADDLSLDFHQGAGIGVRFRLPFGQIRFDVASAISEDGYPIRVHLSVGGDL